jgi:choline dehydrogenase-like flavoprotein
MIVDVRGIPDKTMLHADVAIIGAGPAGITLARELGDIGVMVALFESGGQDYDPDVQALYTGENIGLPYYDLDVTRLRFLGGSSNHWEGMCRPIDDEDFAAYDWIPLSGWPIEPASMQSYFRRAQDILELGAYEYDAEARLKRLDSRNFGTIPFDPRIVSHGVWLFRKGGPVRFAAKYHEYLDKSPSITTYLNASVTELVTSPSGDRIESFTISTLDHKTYTARARIYVLAAGGIENPRILLASNKGTHANGVGNAHDLVGRCFMEHVGAPIGHLILSADDVPTQFYTNFAHEFVVDGITSQAGLILRPEVRREKGLLNTIVTLETAQPAGLGAVNSLKHSITTGMMPASLTEDLLEVIRNLEEIASYYYQKKIRQQLPATDTFTLFARAEQAPNPDSRIILSPKLKDALGMPSLKLNWSITDLDVHSMRQTALVIGQEAARAGIGRVRLADWLQEGSAHPAGIVGGGHHHMGTTRMSSDPKTGVVDADCRVHGVNNLFIAGSSVFPTAGFANPTHTIVAMALRLGQTVRSVLV